MAAATFLQPSPVMDGLDAKARAATHSDDEAALPRLFAEAYDELRELARRQRRRWSGDETLDTTALLHESYLRLVDGSQLSWEDPGHFFAVACRAMRHTLIDYGRGKRARKRGGEREPAPLLLDAHGAAPGDQAAVIALCEELERLAAADARQASVFELRVFLGFSVEETAALLAISPATVKRDWLLATSFLRMSLES